MTKNPEIPLPKFRDLVRRGGDFLVQNRENTGKWHLKWGALLSTISDSPQVIGYYLANIIPVYSLIMIMLSLLKANRDLDRREEGRILVGTRFPDLRFHLHPKKFVGKVALLSLKTFVRATFPTNFLGGR